MKNLRDFILEGKTPKREFFEYVDVWIDEMYQEGLVDYDDEHIKKYAKGKLIPKYNDIVKGVLEEFKNKMSKETKSMLENFLKEENHKDRASSEVIDMIHSAIENFAASIEFPGY